MKIKTNIAVSALALAVSSAFAQSETTGATSSLYQLSTLDPVVVTASRFEEPLSSASTPIYVIQRDEIIQSAASNIVEFLDGVSGLTASRLYGRLGVDAGVDIGFLGGNSARNVLVLIDGQRVNNLNNESIRFAQIPISSIERIEIRKAGAGVLYGDRAIGGVINVITQDGPRKEVSVGAGSYGYKKLEGSIASRVQSITLGVDAMHAQTDGYRDRSAQTQKAARLHGAWQGQQSKASLQLRGYEEDNELPGSISYSTFLVNPKQAQAQNLQGEKSGLIIAATYDYALSDGAELKLFATHEASKNYANTVYGPDNRETEKLSIQPSILLGRAGDDSMLFGVDYLKGENLNLSGLTVRQESAAGYISAEKYLSDKFSISGGFRWQDFSSELKQGSGARSKSDGDLRAQSIGIGYQWGESHRSLLGFSRNFRFPTTEELYYFNNAFTPTAVNPGVNPMRSKEVYVLHRFIKHQIQVEAHARKIKTSDEIDFDFQCSQSPNTALDSCNSNLYDTERNILGLLAKLSIASRMRITASADLVDATILSGINKGKFLPLVPKRSYRATLEGDLDSRRRAIISANYRSSMFASGDPGNAYPVIEGRVVFDLGLVSYGKGSFRYSAWVRNFTNKSYFDFAYGWTNPSVFPADPRTVELNLAYSF